MRILGIGQYHSLGDLYWRLGREGHEVRVHVSEPEAHDIFAGLVTRIDDWRAELPWVRTAGDEGLIVFESASDGALQDALRRDGYRVVGGSAWGDRVENDRRHGQQVMQDAGLRIAESWEFDDHEAAIGFLRERPMRTVYKVSDDTAASTRNYVGELDDGADVIALLRREQRRCQGRRCAPFILMEHLRGVETGIGGYFNGQEFLRPMCLDWEHKRFFPGDVGELTGEMGTLVTYRHYEALYAETLAKLVEPLRRGGYRGWINLNTIINADGVWPLEFTCRFGYPGYAILDALHTGGWGPILAATANGRADEFPSLDGYAVGVVLTVPPFPYEYGYAELSKGMPIFLPPSMSEAERLALHHGEVALDAHGELVTAGSIGYVTVATGTGADAHSAQQAAYALARKVVIPNVRYRNDIAERFMRGEEALLRGWGYLP